MKNKITEIPSKGGIVIYRAKDKKIRLEVKLERETVWLSQNQMAALFGKARNTITEHIQNVFLEGELNEEVVCRSFDIPLNMALLKEKHKYSKQNFTILIPPSPLDIE